MRRRGARVNYLNSEYSNHLWWDDLDKSWRFSVTLGVSCDHELTKSQLYEAYGIVDFSILNESDVFYVELKDGYAYLIQSKQPFEIHPIICVYLKKKKVYKLTKRFCNKDEVKTLRLATTEEVEPYKEHFKLNNMETRPIQISKETATEWFNSTDETLKQLALTAYPELDEVTPKVGDLCLFSDYEEELNNNIGQTGEFDGYSSNGSFKRKFGCTWKFCKKIKSIEFY